MAIQLNSTENRLAKESVQCDRNKTVAIHSLILSLLNRIGVDAMRGRKSTDNGIGVNGDVVKAVHKARKSHMARGHTESYGSVHSMVSGVWTMGVAPFIKETDDEYDPDWKALEADAKLWRSGEKSLWKGRKSNGGNGGTRTKLSPVDAFEKWFTDMSPANQKRWLGTVKGKAFVAMLT